MSTVPSTEYVSSPRHDPLRRRVGLCNGSSLPKREARGQLVVARDGEARGQVLVASGRRRKAASGTWQEEGWV